jgi:cell division septum initiation protein DivIVA
VAVAQSVAQNESSEIIYQLHNQHLTRSILCRDTYLAVLMSLSFERKLEMLRKLSVNEPICEASSHPTHMLSEADFPPLLMQSLVLDLGHEQWTMAKKIWNGGWNQGLSEGQLQEQLPRLSMLLNTVVSEMSEVVKERDLYLQLYSQLKEVSRNNITLWDRVLPFRRTKQLRQTVAHMVRKASPTSRGFLDRARAARKAMRQSRMWARAWIVNDLNERGILDNALLEADEVLEGELVRESARYEAVANRASTQLLETVSALRAEFIQPSWVCEG